MIMNDGGIYEILGGKVVRPLPAPPRCALHGPMQRRHVLSCWVCNGFDGEGCWVPVVSDEKLAWWWVVFNPVSLLVIPLSPAGCTHAPPQQLVKCRCGRWHAVHTAPGWLWS